MSPKASRICATPGCPEIITGTAHYCVRHARLYDAKRGTSAARGYSTGWRKIRDAFLSTHPLCWCGQRATDVDHIKARAIGGSDDASNLQSLCHAHHSQKTATVDSTFAHKGGV